MELIYQSPFRDVFFDTSWQIFYAAWFTTTTTMQNKDWEHEIEHTIDLSEKYRPKYCLLDQRNLLFILSPELIDWTAQQLNPKWIAIGIKKVAVVMSQELITRLGIQIMVEDAQELEIPNQFMIRYFANTDTAKTWLMEN